VKIIIDCPHCERKLDLEVTVQWAKVTDNVLLQHIEDFWGHWSTRVHFCLKNADIKTVGDLVTKCERDLLDLPNFGRRCLDEVKETLAKKGLRLDMNNREP
jgi:DNA-directed RNA polymerase subunit alpha